MFHLKLIRAGALPLGAALSWQHQQQRQQIPSIALASAMSSPSKSLSSFAANNPTEDRSIYYEDNDTNARIFGVFDGHGGWNVSNYLHDNMTRVLLDNVNKAKTDQSFNCTADRIEDSLLKTFSELEENYIDKIRAAYELGFGDVAKVGSCALVVVVQDDDMVVANSGDCLAVLGSPIKSASRTDTHTEAAVVTSESDVAVASGGTIAYHAHQINREHNARDSLEALLLNQTHPNETNLIKCKNPHACYVKGRLQLTRAFGDLYLKSHEFNAPSGSHRSRGRHISSPYTPPYVHYMPDVYKLKLNNATKESKGKNEGKGEFIIVATDGLWDFVKPQEAVDIVAKVANSRDAETAADLLVEEALSRAAGRADVSVTELKNLPPGRERRNRFDDTTVVVVYL